ncbi:unnamed protein product [Arctogadus glacialis]
MFLLTHRDYTVMKVLTARRHCSPRRFPTNHYTDNTLNSPGFKQTSVTLARSGPSEHMELVFGFQPLRRGNTPTAFCFISSRAGV